MAELGALSLRIETVGDRQALSALDAIDVKAKGVAGTEQKLTASQKALNREIAEGTRLFALQGRTIDATSQIAVAELRQSAAAQRAWLQAIGASTQQQEQFNRSVQLFEGRVNQAAAATARATNVTTAFGREVTQANGKLTGFGKSGLNAFNALAFGMSQMAATGTMSFRSLSTSLASVLAFFGPGGAIASATIATGLVLVDFFSRQKKEITELAALAEKARNDAEARRERDDPVGVANERLALARKGVQAIKAEEDALVALNQTRVTSERERLQFEAQLTAIGARKAQALKEEFEFLRQVNDAQAAAAHKLPGVKVEAKSDAVMLAERRKAIADEIEVLLKLSQARKLTTAELARLSVIEDQLTTERAAKIHPTLEREAELWEQIAKARKAANAVIDREIPVPGIQPITSGAPSAAGQLALPNIPTMTPEQTQAMDRANAERVRRENFHETEQALSETLANVLANGIAAGFAEGLGRGGVGEGFRQMAAQLAQGLGSVAIDYGLKAIAVAKIMAGISKWLIANPVLAIAGGVALVALGKALGGRGAARGGAGGGIAGGGGSGGDDTIRSYVLGSNAFSPLDKLSASMRGTIEDLRRSTFGASTIGALSPRSSLGSMAVAGAPSNPWAGMRPLVWNSPEGERLTVTTYNAGKTRGG